MPAALVPLAPPRRVRPAEIVSFREAAVRLGVHYMTAYRYVRTGRLAAHMRNGLWWVDTADLAGVVTSVTGSARPARGVPDPSRHSRRLLDRMRQGDEAGAWTVVEQAMAAGMTPTGVYLDVVAPALRTVGAEWADGTGTVGAEHTVSAVALAVVGRLGPRFVRRGRTRGTVVLAAAPDDHHMIPVRMVADVLRSRGFGVVHLGPATPADSLAEAVARTERLVAVGVSISHESQRSVRRAVAAARRAGRPGLPVLVGGPAVPSDVVAHRLGADHWAPDAVALADLLDSHQTHRSPTDRS